MSALECPSHDEFPDLIPQDVNGVDGKFKSNNDTEFPQEVSVIVCYNPLLDLILAVHRKDDPSDWGLPGGKIEEGESPLCAAMRELVEETCYAVVSDRYMRLLDKRMEGEFSVYVFIVEYDNLAIHTGPSEQNYAWVKPALLTDGSFADFNTQLFSDIASELQRQKKH